MSLVIKRTSWEDYLDPSGGAYVKALIMGVHDAGKTRSASFWPKPIFADCEDGRMSIADRAVPYARIRSTEQMDALLELLRKECQKPAGRRQYETLVIDTFDAYQRTVIQERLKAEKKESLSGWADWGFLDGKMTQLIENLLNLPMNIVVLLHTKDANEAGDDGEESRLVKKARLKGDIKDSIFQDFDLIGQMEVYYKADKGERVRGRHIRWHSEPSHPLPRDRSGRLPRFTEVDFSEQDYWRIFNAMTSGLDELPKDSGVIAEIETPKPAEPAGPDEKGGPVAVGEEAQKQKGARTKKAAEPKEKPVEPEPEPEPTPEPEPVVNGKGTAKVPATLEQSAEVARELLEAGNLRSIDHVHSSDGVCIKNKFGEKCATPPAEDPWEPPAEKEAAPAAEAEVTPEEAEANVAEKLGGEVISEAGARNEGECGYQPEAHRRFTDAPAGCAKDLSTQNRAKVNLSLLRAHATLCESCFDAFRAS